MLVDASGPAARYIRNRGGKLYVWFTPVKISRAYLKQNRSTTKPPRVRLERCEADGFAVYFDSSQPPPEKLTVQLVWPWWLRVTGTGAGTVEFADGGNGG